MAEAESEEAVRLRNKASEMLKGPSSIADPARREHKSSYFSTQSLAGMVNEDPIRLQNQSCVIYEEIVKIGEHEQRVYSSLAHLPTFSIGLSSTEDEAPPRAPSHESSVDPKDKSPPRYFQMPELGARVFVGDVDGFDTIICHLLYKSYEASESDLDSEDAAVRSLYKNDRPGGLSGWLLAQPVKFWSPSKNYTKVILSGTQLIDGSYIHGPMVGNLRGKSLSASTSSSDYKDCTGNETIRQPLDIVEQPRAHVPDVSYASLYGHWTSFEEPYLQRSTEGSYLEMPKFMKRRNRISKHYPLIERSFLQLTRFDDFVIWGNIHEFLNAHKVIDIVRDNASKSTDVIATQLVKEAIEANSERSRHPITTIVIFLEHKEILLRHKKAEEENMATKYKAISSRLEVLKGTSLSTVLKDDKKIAKLKEEEKIITSKEEENISASKREDKKEIMMEEDHKVKILVSELLSNIAQTSTPPLEENELGMKSTTISSNMPSIEVQDDSKASCFLVSIEDDDSKSKDLKVSCHITKWIIYGELLQRTLLCFFNIEKMQYEFYFEDHESMATIIGLGVPHSKVVLECGSPHVTVVEIPKEDWDVAWAHSNVIPYSILKGYVLKQEQFPNILHCIANIINIDNIVSKANNGVGGGNGKGKAHDNANDSKGKGKAQDHDDHGNASHLDEGSNGFPDDNDKKEKKEKDGNDDQKDNRDQDNGKTSNDGKEVQIVVHLHLLPGGILEDKEKKKELGEGREGVEKKKNLRRWWHALKRSKNGNVVENQQERTTTIGVEDGDVDESFLKELENQIHSQMVFTFTYRDEANRPLKTIQATIDPITFQFPNNNEDNYLQRRRFGWFHKKLQVVFGVVNTQAADLNAKSCKVLDSSEAEEVNLQGNSKGNARTTTNAYKGELGIKHGVKASGAYSRTHGSEAKTTDDVQNSWKTNKPLTKGGFSIFEHTDLNAQQLKYSYRPLFPFKEKEFEVIDEDDRLKMYENPICLLQRVSCKGTWQPYSENLEAYKLEASRELRMTRIYDSKLETREEKKKKVVWELEKNLPLCFIQKFEKVVYLNHAMSHLTSSKTEVYLKEHRDDPFLTQAFNNREPKWPSNSPLVDVNQNMNI